jgi:predicted RNA-binding Zn-ribbon protein involved in translation (DUF1610 family)
VQDVSARGALAGGIVEMDAVKVRVYCEKCGSDKVRRVYRKGFLQETIYPIFGYYPWKCMRCGEKVFLRKRNRLRSKDYVE